MEIGQQVLEKIFEGFFTIYMYGRGGHLGNVTQMPQTNFRSPYPWRLHTKFSFDWPNGFGDGCLSHVNDNGAWVYYKLTYEPKLM